MTEKKKELLFDQFPPVSTEEWKAKVEADLKGAPFDKKLVWRTNEGFNVQPMYRAEDIASLNTTDSLPGEYPFVRGTRVENDWLTRQEIVAETAKEANEKALDVLTKGVTSLGFKVKEATSEELQTLLAGIDVAAVELNFSTCIKKAETFATVLAAYLKENGLEAQFRGSIDFNPLKKALKHGVAFNGDAVAIAKNILEAVKDVPALKVLSVNSVMLSNAGSYIFQELGYAMAWGAEWLTLLTDAGVDATTVASRIKFNMGVSSDYFMELAKFRAARMLWAKIVEQYSPECLCACKMIVHAETSQFNLTLFDSYVNMLRTQTEAMSAAIAGVESITVTPYNTVYEDATDFSTRIAKNQQLILKHESHLDKVTDPAGGSYYIESLTASIANEAWKQFLAIENDGGFHKAVKEGKVQADIEKTADSRRTALAKRKEILLGTNQYPNFCEMSEGKRPKAHACGCGCHSEEEQSITIATKRLGEDFEQLRLQTEESGRRPKAFMLTIGNLAMRQARAQFSCNFLATAGYKVIDNLGFKSIEDGVNAAIDSKADIVVICSSDDEYAEYAIPAYKAIGNKAIFIVAGAPACMPELQQAGIENFIHVRVNILDTLRELNRKLGI